MKIYNFLISLLLLFGIIFGQTVNTASGIVVEDNNVEADDSEIVTMLKVKYTSLGVPNLNTSFKSYMDYRCITDSRSSQYKFIQQWGWVDEQGFMKCSGERDLGINDDYYLIALGSYYGTQIGTKYRITLDNSRIIYGVLADCKADVHTNSTNQYIPHNKNIVEFVVDVSRLNKDVKYHGNANVYELLNGVITKIEKIEFVD